ncbi:hypothetical protein [Pseudomonas sp. RIT-PI-AD]|uniref:hypothetical protein n=1 Tax=Pseudomonas sp. RIT-PI-AD TaxID=3035294 RepID=UPI0021DA4784|nr:hypothetical protein [Pseudomonas sp. RIT-PI-AD]
MSELDLERWRALWQRLGGTPPTQAFDELRAAYAEPQRHYHGTRHIVACLAHFDAWRALAQDPDAVELAL